MSTPNPITGARLLYEFDVEFDRYASETEKDLAVVDKVFTLNNALQTLFSNWVRLAETDEYIKENLRPFERKDVELEVQAHTADIVVAPSPPDSYRILRRSILVAKEYCDTKLIPLTPFRVHEISLGLKSLWRPSFEWEQCFYDEGEKGMYIYHNREFKVLKTIVDYYRHPEPIHAPTMAAEGFYVDWDGVKQTKDSILELTGFAHRQLIDIAVLTARSRFGDGNDYSVNIQNIIQKRNII